MDLPSISSSLHLSCDSMACGVSFVQHYPVIRFFFQLVSPPQASLPISFFSSLIFFSVMGAYFASSFCGVSWLGCSIMAAMWVLLNLGAGCQKGKLLDTPGTQPSTGNAVVKCNNYLNVFEFTFIHRSRQPIPRKVKWQSHILEQC